METIRASLTGNDRDEHVLALRQSLDLYDTYQSKIAECDRELEASMSALIVEGERPAKPLSKARVRTKQVNAPTFDVRAALYDMLGVDLTQIHGLGPSLALKLVSECGRDLKAWPSAKHFTSWLCLAPGNKISGEKVLSSKTRRSSSRAAALLRLAATTTGRTDSAWGFLPAAVVAHRQVQSRHGDGEEDSGAVLQCPSSWHGIQGSRGGSL
jgi:transposase